MDLSNAITMDPAEAATQAADLASHRGMLTDEERQMLAGYEALAGGHSIINLPQAVALGGCFDDDRALPRVAVARPQDRWIHVERHEDGRVRFGGRGAVTWAGGSTWERDLGQILPPCARWTSGNMRAMVPPVPVAIRWRLGRPGGGGWRKCLTLFEVGEWAEAPRPPGDPALLRPLVGDLYLVVATWDLTELERAVLAGARADG